MRYLLLLSVFLFGTQLFAQINETPQVEETIAPQNSVEQVSNKSELKLKRIERPRVKAAERKEPVVTPSETEEKQK